jgi:site-specific DNA-methyltransferase (cytosine-N4-specific)
MLLPQFQLPVLPAYQDRIQRAYTTDGATSNKERVALELKYAALLTPTDEFNRKLVSYQANKQARLHSWLKYKEGFSAQLVEILIDKFDVRPGQHILDPFAGSATTLLVAKELGINAMGIELLPVCHLAWQAKSRYHEYDLAELRQVLRWLQQTKPELSATPFPHIVITQSAFSPEEEAKLMWYTQQFQTLPVSALTKLLLQLMLVSVLEDISYTRKDGQYLRWDARAAKVQQRQTQRAAQGKPPFKPFDKGKILNVQQALSIALSEVIHDLELLQQNGNPASEQDLIQGTVLEILPTRPAAQFEAVITSPPYCNRYDYTRTYALELAYLGVGEHAIKDLRQTLLSCTVENHSKLRQLEAFYTALQRAADFKQVKHVIDANAPLQEVFNALRTRGARGELNNTGVIQMVEGYFTELAFVIYELYRVCRPNAHVAIVNDNVRYGSEIIPVDLLMTDLAASFGFRPEAIYVLPQRKGNSSQQMGKYGREANRKSITIWKKSA